MQICGIVVQPNKTGQRRRVLFMDVRRRNIPQLLNQRIYLDESNTKKIN